MFETFAQNLNNCLLIVWKIPKGLCENVNSFLSNTITVVWNEEIFLRLCNYYCFIENVQLDFGSGFPLRDSRMGLIFDERDERYFNGLIKTNVRLCEMSTGGG
jgi:hypothetical protein